MTEEIKRLGMVILNYWKIKIYRQMSKRISGETCYTLSEKH